MLEGVVVKAGIDICGRFSLGGGRRRRLVHRWHDLMVLLGWSVTLRTVVGVIVVWMNGRGGGFANRYNRVKHLLHKGHDFIGLFLSNTVLTI